MTVWTIAMRHLQRRLVASALTAVSVALGVGLVLGSVLLTHGIRDSFVRGTTDWGLVIGAKGSPTQLVLSVLFRTDLPTPNILYSTYRELRADRRVETAVPVALGDAFQGFRYVATTPDYFSARRGSGQGSTLASGRLFRDDALERPSHEAVLGAEAARATKLEIGDRFYEGEEMAAYPLTVVGILRPVARADDRGIFVSLSTHWAMNEVARRTSDKPLTAVLVRARRMSDLPSLHREMNLAEGTQAVFPSAVLLNIFNVVALVEDALTLVLVMVAVVVLLYVCVTMYGATLERQRGIATMRALGARRALIVQVIVLESCAITVAGGIAGLVVGHGIALIGARILSKRGGLVTDPFAVGALEPALLAGVVLLGAAAAVVPAIVAYRTDVAKTLAPLS